MNVPALNDSKYIGMSVYNVVVMSTLGLSISVILQVHYLVVIATTVLGGGVGEGAGSGMVMIGTRHPPDPTPNSYDLVHSQL